MDPPRRNTQTSNSDSSSLVTEEMSQETKSTSQPSSIMQDLDFINFNLSQNCSYLTPLPEDLLQLLCRDEKNEENRRRERSTFPQRKKTFTENIRQKTLNHMAPYRVEREGKLSNSNDENHNKCKCHYCQIQREAVPEAPKVQSSSSGKMLEECVCHLNLDSDTSQPCCILEELPQNGT